MTEKDYYKIKKFNFTKIKYLKLELEVKDVENLIGNILKLYD